MELEEICKDVQVLGKWEMTVLLKYRSRVLKWEGKHRFEKKRKEKEEEKKLKQSLRTEEDYEAEVEENLDNEITDQQQKDKRKAKKQKEKDAKNDYRMKMSVLASTSLENADDELGFGKKIINHFV